MCCVYTIHILTICFVRDMTQPQVSILCFVRPQLFFHCTLRPTGTVAGRYNRSDEDIPLNLVFFSPFEDFRLRTAGIMESKGTHRVALTCSSALRQKG